MSIAALNETLPAYARDIARNLEVLAGEDVLNDQQKWGCFLACAHAVGVGPVVRATEAEAQARLSPEVADAARTAAAIMGMNNVYYRALHTMKNGEYGFMPSKLRMSALNQPGVDRLDFELWSLAVSAVNGCGACLDAHEAELKAQRVPAAVVQTALRIAAVVHAASRVVAGAEAAKG
jgi:lipoyl-dependent peroxiredoxin subunit D